MPEPSPVCRIGGWGGSQPLKAPTTAPAAPFGAHHRRRGRLCPPQRELDRPLDEVRAELLVEARMRAFTKQIEVVTGKRETGSGDGAHGMSFITTHSSDLPQWLYF